MTSHNLPVFKQSRTLPRAFSWVFFGVFFGPSAISATLPPLADRLVKIRERVSTLEQELIEGSRLNQNTRKQISKIKNLLALQKQEQELGRKRLLELEGTIQELEVRKATLSGKVRDHQKAVRKFLMAIENSSREQSFVGAHHFHLPESEKIEAPRRKVLANLVDRGLKEIEILRVDLSDAAKLESRIQEERQQLAYFVQDLNEQKSILELNSQMKADYLKKHQNQRVSQLEKYRALKNAEKRMESMIQALNVRKELESSLDIEHRIARNFVAFSSLKGKLSLPVLGGKIVGKFGRAFDSRTGLNIFKKGIEIQAGKGQKVRAVSGGKIAFAGALPHYGQVVMIDHGDHFYSLCAHLGAISKKTDESVGEGEIIGQTDNQETPVYFEIRARNVAVNPLRWLSN